jgi:hypothetical protein
VRGFKPKPISSVEKEKIDAKIMNFFLGFMIGN